MSDTKPRSSISLASDFYSANFARITRSSHLPRLRRRLVRLLHLSGILWAMASTPSSGPIVRLLRLNSRIQSLLAPQQIMFSN